MHPSVVSDLLRQSRLACSNAYAPYSGFHVGAAALFDGSGHIFAGSNVENKSYGLTICAERSAIFAGVSAGLRRLSHVAVSCRDKQGNLIAGKPCGACLQVINEFGTRDTKIILADGRSMFLCEFLPHPFGI